MVQARPEDDTMKTRKKIAIIGTGISGLTCAYRLHRNHDLTIFEAADYIGGHTHTVDVEYKGEHARIDTGFIVFNDRTYPNFRSMMKEIGVESQKSEMSFSVRNDQIGLEYNGGSINGLFTQRKNVASPRFWRLLGDIVRFNRSVKSELARNSNLTIGDYLDSTRYSSIFGENYLLPMISAIWSMGLDSCRDFPLSFFVRFFDNHGLLDLINRPQWYTIIGGSSSYIEPLTAPFKDLIKLQTPVQRVMRRAEGVELIHTSGRDLFDEVIFACHGDQALQLIDSPSTSEQDILGPFRCTDNDVVLHTDTSILPAQKNGWASWNYRVVDQERTLTTLTYNMNILQRLTSSNTYLVSLNQEISPSHVLNRFNYRHPVFSLESIAAQERWQQISGVDRLHFCGAYWYNGFHEDGVKSGLRVCQSLEVE